MENVVIGNIVANALKDVALTGALTEIVSLIPLLAPVAIGYLAIRKAWSFVMGVLSAA